MSSNDHFHKVVMNTVNFHEKCRCFLSDHFHGENGDHFYEIGQQIKNKMTNFTEMGTLFITDHFHGIHPAQIHEYSHIIVFS